MSKTKPPYIITLDIIKPIENCEFENGEYIINRKDAEIAKELRLLFKNIKEIESNTPIETIETIENNKTHEYKIKTYETLNTYKPLNFWNKIKKIIFNG